MPVTQPLSPEILIQIPELRKQGLSNYAVAKVLGIGETTVRKYKNYDPKGHQVLDSYTFTQRQLDIAIAALEVKESLKK